jgi:hypothetical protein
MGANLIIQTLDQDMKNLPEDNAIRQHWQVLCESARRYIKLYNEHVTAEKSGKINGQALAQMGIILTRTLNMYIMNYRNFCQDYSGKMGKPCPLLSQFDFNNRLEMKRMGEEIVKTLYSE